MRLRMKKTYLKEKNESVKKKDAKWTESAEEKDGDNMK